MLTVMGHGTRPLVVLDVEHHCVETAARSAHRRLAQELMCGRGNKRAEDQLSLLGDFLETTNFRALRSAHPELAGGSSHQVFLGRGADGAVSWWVLDEGGGS